MLYSGFHSPHHSQCQLTIGKVHIYIWEGPSTSIYLCRRAPERILFCGWRRDMHDMIAVLDAFVYPGSELWLYNEVSNTTSSMQTIHGSRSLCYLKIQLAATDNARQVLSLACIGCGATSGQTGLDALVYPGSELWLYNEISRGHFLLILPLPTTMAGKSCTSMPSIAVPCTAMAFLNALDASWALWEISSWVYVGCGA